MKTKKKPLSIYIHIPFCVRKCLYCDFLSGPAGDETKSRYVEQLLEEIRRKSVKYDSYEVHTVFLGGGTPSLLPAFAIERILKTVESVFCMKKECEISIEVNPGTVTEEKLMAYREMGINRLSIGLQSADNEELRLLGRIHTYEDFLMTYKAAIKSGFNNINIDLMSAIPAQTMQSYQETLNKVLSLNPQPAHISAYSLIIEEGTPFYENTPPLPDEETERELYKITSDILSKAGYQRYEISNYAKSGYQCAHNKVYWKRGDYVGFGIGAASLVDNVRFKNTENMESYLSGRDVREDVQTLSVEEQMEEYMFLGLRLTEGIQEEDFKATFGRTIEEIYPGVVEKFVKQGLLSYKPGDKPGAGCIALTDYGLDVSNVVMAEFLLSDESV